MLNRTSGNSRMHRWMKHSTRAFLDEARRTSGFTFFDTLHGYAYLRWAYTYIALAVGEHWISRTIALLQGLLPPTADTQSKPSTRDQAIADVYHGKVLRTDAARQLVSVKEDVSLPDLESVIPYPQARDIVLLNPDHILAVDCPCRTARSDPCLPIDVCLIIGEPFAGFIREHHPEKARWVDTDEACSILEREHKRGRVHQAFFKDATLGRFYVICNCCSCCCGAMQAKRDGVPLLADSGYSSRIDVQTCTTCRECVETCAFDAIEWIDGKPRVLQGSCMGCGICSTCCPSGSIRMARDPAKSEPLEIAKLIANKHSAKPERIRSHNP